MTGSEDHVQLQAMIGSYRAESLIGRPGDEWIPAFERAVEEYYQGGGESALRPLMGLLGDDLPDEVNFSLIHTIEQAEVASYVQALIALTVDHGGESAYWLDVLHFRVFNDPPAVDAYVQGVRAIGPEERVLVSRYIDALTKDPRNAKFSPQISRLQKMAGGS